MSRGLVATVLVILGCVLAGPALAAYALDRQITDQDRYLGAVEPLADEAVVRQAIVDAINEKLGVLPASARRLVETGVTKVVESDAFRPAWITVNRVAHPHVIAMLRGEPGSLRIEDDTVLLDIGVVAAEVQVELHHRTLESSGELAAKRRRQQVDWVWTMVRDTLLARLHEHAEVRRIAPALERQVRDGLITPTLAAERILEAFWTD